MSPFLCVPLFVSVIFFLVADAAFFFAIESILLAVVFVFRRGILLSLLGPRLRRLGGLFVELPVFGFGDRKAVGQRTRGSRCGRRAFVMTLLGVE